MGKWHQREGYVSVFLAMILLITFSLVMTAVESVRISAIRMQTEMACAIACEAFLSQYQPLVQQRYGLFMIERDGYDDTFLKTFIEKNCQNNVYGYATWMSAVLESVAINDEVPISDQSYDYMLMQISELMTVMKTEDVLGRIKDIVSDYASANTEEQKDTFSNSVSSTGWQAELQQQEDEKSEDEKENVDTEQNVKDPRENITGLLQYPILSLLTEGDVSEALLDVSSLSFNVAPETESTQIRSFMDYRQTVSGLADVDLDVGNLVSESSEALLLHCYMVEFLKNASQSSAVSGDSVLSYEIEYIISGQACDGDNLRYVMNRIVMIRMIFNIAYLYQCSTKMSAIRTVAVSLASAMLMPYLEEVFVLLILAAWAYGEALLDCRTLLGGGKVPLMKDDTTWTLSLNGLSYISKYSFEILEKDNSSETGLDYVEYLHILLACVPMEKKCVRLFNVIEANVRLDENYSDFMIHQCVVGISICADFRIYGLFAANRKNGGIYEHHVQKMCTY